MCVCVRLSLSLSYSHRHKKIFRHKKNTDLPHKKKLLQHTWQSKSMTLLSRWGSCIGNTPAPWASPAARRSRYYQRSPTHGDPSSLPPRNWKKNLVPNLDNHGRSPHLFVHVSNLWKFGRQVRSSFFIVLLGFTFHNINITLF